MKTSRLIMLLAATFACVSSFAQNNRTYNPSLKHELICDFADWTPEDVEVKGSTQGFAMHGKYAFVMHDKGMCCIFDMKKKAYVNSFMMPGMISVVVSTIVGYLITTVLFPGYFASFVQ